MSLQLPSLVARWRPQLQEHQHRGAITLLGPRSWGYAEALALGSACFWLSDEPPPEVEALPPSRGLELLGCEHQILILDLHTAPGPDTLGALSGVVRGGGFLILLMPEQSPQAARRQRLGILGFEEVYDRFPRRLRRILLSDPHMLLLRPGGESPELPSVEPQAPLPPSPDPDCLSLDQSRAVKALIQVAKGRRRRPVVLSSDRGRGKSAALGIAAGRLLKELELRIVVTAPHRASVQPLFDHARRVLGLSGRGRLRFGQGELRFMAPGELLQSPPELDLLWVDEAAALPIPLLSRLLQRYPRVAFSSTIHGYEGTGRGFALRFCALLDKRAPGWRAVYMESPIRWAPGDPLERLLFKALLLEARPPSVDAISGALPQDCQLQRLGREALLSDEEQLSALFGLLIMAHYRTSPGDLERLLDASNLIVFSMAWEGQIVGAALISQEGGLSAEMSAAIYEGRRRPRGHMLPETLCVHSGLEEAPQLRAWRVIRIAIHPGVQARGLGSRFLAWLQAQAGEAGVDYIGSGFGATAQLLRFWRRAGFLPLRLGVRPGKSSGAYSAVVVHPFSPRAQQMLAEERPRFRAQLPLLLSHVLPRLEPELVEQLLWEEERVEVELSPRGWRDLLRCVYAQRGYDLSVGPCQALCLAGLSDPELRTLLSPEERYFLIRRIFQAWPWERFNLGPRGGSRRVARLLKPWTERRCSTPGLIERFGGRGAVEGGAGVSRAEEADEGGVEAALHD